MSSYPGQIASADDFYQLNSQLVVMETSDNIFINSLYDVVVPETLLSWQRTTLANRIAHDGPTWNKIFAEYNSGTYNNQWIIVDYKNFISNNKSNVLWIVEQIPGLVLGSDESDMLYSQSYFASYNIPFFEEIYNISGYSIMDQKYGDSFSWSKCPRANIFRRNQTLVHDLSSMKNLMRYNNFQHDPLSENSASGAICARDDLSKANPSPMGCTDSKVANINGVLNGKTSAAYGPTHDQQIPFSWKKWGSWPHSGLPNNYDFGWTIFSSKV